MLDIRRDNLLEHLLFKSLFAMSRNRLEYLCLLLGKPVPPTSTMDRTADRRQSGRLPRRRRQSTQQTVAATRTASNDRITRFGVPLDAHDREMIDRYRAAVRRRGTRHALLEPRPQQSQRLSVVRRADRSRRTAPGSRSAISPTRTAFQFVRTMQLDDRIVPVIGNVAGDKAVQGDRAVRDRARARSSRRSICRTSSSISWGATAASTRTRRT